LRDKVVFTGIRRDIPQVLWVIDIFVMPSLNEGMPISLLEAMAAKKTIIATRVGSVPDVIKNEFSGILVNPGNVQDLSQSIIEVLDNPKKAEFLSENAFATVSSSFSAKKMAQKYVEVYESLLN